MVCGWNQKNKILPSIKFKILVRCFQSSQKSHKILLIEKTFSNPSKLKYLKADGSRQRGNIE